MGKQSFFQTNMENSQIQQKSQFTKIHMIMSPS
jgi:hypothetical protein